MESVLLGSEASGSMVIPLSTGFVPHGSPYFTRRKIKRKLDPNSTTDFQSLEPTRDAAQLASRGLHGMGIPWDFFPSRWVKKEFSIILYNIKLC
jgi:hypothetical protein